MTALDESVKESSEKAKVAYDKATEAIAHTPSNFQEMVDKLASLQIQMSNMVAEFAVRNMELDKSIATVNEQLSSIADDMPDVELPSDVIRRGDLNAYDLQLAQVGQGMRSLEAQMASKADTNALSLFNSKDDTPISDSVHAMVVDMHAKVNALNAMTNTLRADVDKGDFEIRAMRSDYARVLSQQTSLADELQARHKDLTERIVSDESRTSSQTQLSKIDMDGLLKTVAKRSDFDDLAERLLALADGLRQIETKLSQKVDSAAIAAITTALTPTEGDTNENVRLMLVDLHTKVIAATDNAEQLRADCTRTSKSLDELSARVTKETDAVKHDVRRLETAVGTTPPDMVTKATLAGIVRSLASKSDFEEAADRLIRTTEERGRMLENRLNERIHHLTIAKNEPDSSALPFIAMYRDLDIRIRESQEEIQRLTLQLAAAATAARRRGSQMGLGVAQLSMSRNTLLNELRADGSSSDEPSTSKQNMPSSPGAEVDAPATSSSGGMKSPSFRAGAFSDGKMDVVIAGAVEALNARVVAMETQLRNFKDQPLAPSAPGVAAGGNTDLLQHDVVRLQSDVFSIRAWMEQKDAASDGVPEKAILKRLLSEHSNDGKEKQLIARMDALSADMEQIKGDRMGNAASQLIGKQQAALQEMSQKLAALDTSMRRAQAKTSFELKQRITKADLEALSKQNGFSAVDGRAPPNMPRRMAGAPAVCQCDPADPAVLRRPVPSGFHCISCDRHVDIGITYRTSAACMESRGLRGAALYSEPPMAMPSIRSAGGAYTNGQIEGPISVKECDVHDRATTGYMQEDLIKTSEVGVVGTNGKVYKGRKRLVTGGALPPIDTRPIGPGEHAEPIARASSRSNSRPGSPEEESHATDNAADLNKPTEAQTAEPLN
eukprot:Opistho-2@26308